MSPERSAKDRLLDVLECTERIRATCAPLTAERFTADPLVSRAVLYDLLCIGEAIARLPDSLLETASDIPWSSIVGLRNRIAHGYFAIDLDLVWNMVSEDLPLLEAATQQLISRF